MELRFHVSPLLILYYKQSVNIKMCLDTEGRAGMAAVAKNKESHYKDQVLLSLFLHPNNHLNVTGIC